MAVLLNSADFSRSCISSSCSNRKNMINNYLTILCKKMSIFSNISSNFLGTSLDPRQPFGPKPPEIPTQKLPKQHPFFIKREINCEILLYELIHEKVDCREWCCSHIACTLFNKILLPSQINNSNKKITPCAKVANVGSLSANEKWPQIYLQVSICYFCDKYDVF